MFCKNCGVPLNEGAKFCRNCGTPVTQPQPVPELRRSEEQEPGQRPREEEIRHPRTEQEERRRRAGQDRPHRSAGYPETELPKGKKSGKKKDRPENDPPKKEKRRFRGGQIAACLILLVLAAGCITGTVLVTRRLANPERAAQHFLDAVLAGDVDTAYGMLDFTDVDAETQAILTEEVFAQLLPSQEELDQDLTGQVEALSRSQQRNLDSAYEEDTDHRHLSLVWSAAGSRSETDWQVTLVRQEEKQWLLFPVWKVAAVDLPTEELEIHVPAGAEATLNGQPLPESWNRGVDENGGTRYQGQVWDAFYDLEASLTGFANYRDAVEAGDTVEISFQQLEEEERRELLSRSGGYMEEILTAASQGTSSETISEITANGADYDYSQDLASLQAVFNPGDGSGIQGMVVSGLEGSVTVYQEGEEIWAQVDLDSQASFQLLSPTTDPLTGAVTYTTQPVVEDMSAIFSYQYQDGQWKLMEMYF